MKIRPARGVFYVHGRTDGHDETNILAFSNFANAPIYPDVCVVGMAFRPRQTFNIRLTVRNNRNIIIVRGYYYSTGPRICFYMYIC